MIYQTELLFSTASPKIIIFVFAPKQYVISVAMRDSCHFEDFTLYLLIKYHTCLSRGCSFKLGNSTVIGDGLWY